MIDLSICSATLVQRILWSTLPEIYNSDHIPIKIKLLSNKTTPNTTPSLRWKLKNPNWNLFAQLTESYINTNPRPPLKNPIKNGVIHITESITIAANISIAQTKVTLNNPRVP